MSCSDELINKNMQSLIQAAQKACSYAYAPYSRFRVGAAVLCENGEIYAGCNVENASYGAAICAERSAVSNAVVHGNKKIIATAVAVPGDAPAAPCGICRQVLYEFNPDMTVFLCNSTGLKESYKLSDLLPHGFRLSIEQ